MSITLSIKLIRFWSVDVGRIPSPVSKIQLSKALPPDKWKPIEELGTRLFAITWLVRTWGRRSGNEAKRRTNWTIRMAHWLKLRPWRIVAWARPHIWHVGLLSQYLAVWPFAKQWKQRSRFDKMSTLESTGISIKMVHWEVEWEWSQTPHIVKCSSGGICPQFLLIIAHRSTNSTKLR